MGLSAFKGVSQEVLNSGLKGSQQMSLGAHNSLLQIANAGGGYGTASAWGAGLGAGYGAIDGAFSYDGSILGGAFHGAMMGGVGGAGAKFAASTYAKGALELGSASGTAGAFKNSWTKAAKNAEGEPTGAFSLSAFGRGW